jgi:hypothetical protein
MFKVTDESGNTFVFGKFEEIEAFFGEVTMAVGAIDAKITIEWNNLEEYTE